MNGNSADGMDTRWINMREQKQAKRILLKRIVHPKLKFYHHLLNLMSLKPSWLPVFFLNESQWGPVLF